MNAEYTRTQRDLYSVCQLGTMTLLVWQKSLERKLGQKSLVAVGGKLYGALGPRNGLVALDGASGKVLKTYTDVGGVRELVALDGTLVLFGQGRRGRAGISSRIIALDIGTSTVRWRVPVKKFAHSSLAAADGHVCFYDGSEVVCLRLTDGKRAWQTACVAGARNWPMMIYRGVVLVPNPKGLKAFSFFVSFVVFLFVKPSLVTRSYSLFCFSTIRFH